MDVDLPLLGMKAALPSVLVEAHWESFDRQGFLDLGPVILPEEAEWLRRCADGLVRAELVELISDEGARPFLELMHHPLFHEVCFKIYGPGAPVMLFSGEVSDPPSIRPPWRQDASLSVHLDREKIVTIVVSLGDAAGRKATVEVVPRSHRLGLLEVSDGGVSPAAATRENLEDRFVSVRIDSGCAVLLHKWLVHRPGQSEDQHGSRTAAFVFVDGHVRSLMTGHPHLPMVLGMAPPEHQSPEPGFEEDRAFPARELEKLRGRWRR